MFQSARPLKGTSSPDTAHWNSNTRNARLPPFLNQRSAITIQHPRLQATTPTIAASHYSIGESASKLLATRTSGAPLKPIKIPVSHFYPPQPMLPESHVPCELAHFDRCTSQKDPNSKNIRESKIIDSSVLSEALRQTTYSIHSPLNVQR